MEEAKRGRGKPSDLTIKQWNTLRVKYETGEKMKAMTTEYRVSADAIYQYAKRHGWAKRGAMAGVIAEAAREKAIEAAAGEYGTVVRDICERHLNTYREIEKLIQAELGEVFLNFKHISAQNNELRAWTIADARMRDKAKEIAKKKKEFGAAIRAEKAKAAGVEPPEEEEEELDRPPKQIYPMSIDKEVRCTVALSEAYQRMTLEAERVVLGITDHKMLSPESSKGGRGLRDVLKSARDKHGIMEEATPEAAAEGEV